MRRLFFPRLPLGRCSPANPSEDGGFEDVVEFCSRNASFRSSSKIFLSRSISSCRSLSTSRLRRSFSRSSCSGFNGSSSRGWRCDALKHIHCQVFQAISRSKPKILKDFCDATFTGPELLPLFNVGGPVAPVVSVVSGSVVTDQNILVNPSTGQPYYDPSGTQVLVYEGVSKLPLAGNPTPTFPNPYTAGITISGSVTQPPGVAGKMVFVQLLDSYNVVLSAPGLQNGGCLFAGLDGGFPYGAVGPSSGPTTYMYDSPKVSLVAPTTYASAIFSAHAYVMWQPSLPSSIPVPLGYVRWGLSGYAENNGAAWVLDTSDPVNKPNAGYASDFQVGNTYPNWSSFVPPQPSCAKPN